MELRPYQRLAVDHLHRVGRGALFLDMGLGKTAAALTALTPDHLPALVTAPKRVAEHVWAEEARRWRPEYRLGVAAGNPAHRHHILATGALRDITVIGSQSAYLAVLPPNSRCTVCGRSPALGAMSPAMS